ncbi:MAG: MMPL family transporter [Acidimicrobiales bacterium]
MQRLFSGLGRGVVRYRYLVVALWIVAILVSSRALPSLGSEVNNNNSQFLPASAPSTKALDLSAPLGAATNVSSVSIVASRDGAVLTTADQEALSREIAAAKSVHEVVSVRGLGTSPRGQAAVLLVEAKIGFSDVSSQKTLVDSLRSTFSHIDAPPGLRLHLAGQVAVNVANQQGSNKTSSRTASLSLLIVVVLLLVVFRSLLAPLITLLGPAFALVTSTRFIGGLGAHGLKISEITELLLIVLLIGAGTDYGLFLVFRVREEIRGGLEPHEAVVRSLVRVGESISASAGTVILALLTLLLATFGVYHDLGIPLALGVAVMLLAGLTLLPALLAIFGRAVFWPADLTGAASSEGTWGRVAARLVRHPVATLLWGVVLFGGLAFAALGYHSGGFGGTLTAPAGSDAAAGTATLAHYFPKASANPTNLILRYDEPLWDSPSRLETAESVLRASGQFRQITGPLDPNGYSFSPAQYSSLHQLLGNPGKLEPLEPAGLGVSSGAYNAYRATTNLVSADGRTVQFEASLNAGDPGSTKALQAVPAIRAALDRAARASGANADGVAGEAPSIYDVSSASNSDLSRIIPVAIIAIGILLALVLRSLVAPWYLIVSVALSYFAALGVSTIVFIDVAGNGGLTFILPFLMFIFLLALGEDYNILVMSRIREEAHHSTLREAVVRAVGRTGPTVTSAGLVLAGSFVALAVAGGSGPGGGQVRAIGFGLAIGILMDTFFVRTLLVPSTVFLLRRWNWWPAKMGRRVESGEFAPGEADGADGRGSDAPLRTSGARTR